MIKSMTGYARSEKILDGMKISVEIKSVNHRFSEYTIKVPRHLLSFEDRIRKYAGKYIARGKIDIYLNVENFEKADKEIFLNESLAKNYLDAVRKLRDVFDLKDDISTMGMCKFSDIFVAEHIDEDEEELWDKVSAVLEEAFESFCAMRMREGERLYADLKKRVDYMKSIAEKIDKVAPTVVADYQKRLYDRIKATLDGADISEDRVLTEVAIFADKVAINEEIVRLASHFDEFYNLLESVSPSGRQLDFLVQEMNREINTTGSKANDIEISKMVVILKAELEKIREQIQNIE